MKAIKNKFEEEALKKELNHEMEKTVSMTVEQQGKPFPDHVSQALESFYNRGMVGWGENAQC